MNGHERLMRIFEGKETDRPALKLWGFSYGQPLLHPAFRPVTDQAAALSDWMEGKGSPFNIYCGRFWNEMILREERPVPGKEWVDRITYLKLPGRTLRSIFRYSPDGEPGYELEHFVKDTADLRALLDSPYEPFPMDLASYQERQRVVGEKGIVLFEIDHAGYAVSRLMGSELFACFCIEERELLQEAVAVYHQRLKDHLKQALSAGVQGVFGWVGPELILPPLARPADFEDFVFSPDRTLCDLIHNGGGRVWVHSHGKVKHFIQKFLDMGVDVLNPIEPPPQGDVTLREAFEIAGGRMGLEGNIETLELFEADPERLRCLIREAAQTGKEAGRFILCPSSGYMETVKPTPTFIRNLQIYLEYGLACLTEK